MVLSILFIHPTPLNKVDSHAIAQVIREAEQAKKEGTEKTILFNMCGHGFVDMQAYNDYFEGKLSNHSFGKDELREGLSEIRSMQPSA